MKWINKKLTKNFTEVPLFMATFDLEKYNKNGPEKSCLVKVHPSITDEYVKEQLNAIIDHIRANYDMKKLSE